MVFETTTLLLHSHSHSQAHTRNMLDLCAPNSSQNIDSTAQQAWLSCWLLFLCLSFMVKPCIRQTPIGSIDCTYMVRCGALSQRLLMLMRPRRMIHSDFFFKSICNSDSVRLASSPASVLRANYHPICRLKCKQNPFKNTIDSFGLDIKWHERKICDVITIAIHNIGLIWLDTKCASAACVRNCHRN